jgi:beta-lactamase superfamily II metal-dependent hydrolase
VLLTHFEWKHCGDFLDVFPSFENGLLKTKNQKTNQKTNQKRKKKKEKRKTKKEKPKKKNPEIVENIEILNKRYVEIRKY